ncbi:putative GSCFA family protein [Dinoroseobacter shibae DFL 12 = DSM 16493]|jgi:hypothetical protein|uniref:Putative GSCFA family protein n=1 Tax=Dinoroseobacter shibae (strain DSM 16493 / NCIMB 14021 / DFL 12) TaxID=398580 RepID=A8LP01_DINSH|nr:GSCFA domain-containing protein [Dinoroseobacter shibae]ABV93683.1 putative GSCFA family protein [Dinoroseobacter shibae DFL 12 = DSM 16493]URF45136.1 GSCFA domain-containing protein [Dinoroseobacter shibae]URF49441.1 GSCFA domain-containing protein [Dinoroseobacter shibae]
MTSNPIETGPAPEVLRRASRNPLRRYPTPDAGGDRLYPLAMPAPTPSFEFSSKETVFALGSCFARNIEDALAAEGFRVLSREFDLGEIGASLDDAANFFNKYTIHSMLNELRWAFDRDSFPGADMLYPLRDDDTAYRDLQLGSAKLAFPRDRILAFRHRFLDAVAQIAEADVVVMTLGYVEGWRDTRLDLALNTAPPPALCAREPDRFAFEVLSYEDVLGGLRAFHALLTAHRTKPLKMLLTVSPVPLLSTFRDMDVLVANSYSKAVQRAAVETFVAETPGVDYFPSYECVTLSDPAAIWTEGDFRHVAPDLVTRIMSSVLTAYVPGWGDKGALTRAATRATTRLLLGAGRHDELLALLDAHGPTDDAELTAAHALALRRTDRTAQAVALMCEVVERTPDDPQPLERVIRWCEQLDRMAVARDYLDLHAQRFPKRRKFRRGRKCRKAANRGRG